MVVFNATIHLHFVKVNHFYKNVDLFFTLKYNSVNALRKELDFMLDLYKNIKQRRTELGLSQSELAEKIGYSDKSMISRIESGMIDLSQSKIIEFANILNTTPGALMGWEIKIDQLNNNGTISNRFKTNAGENSTYTTNNFYKDSSCCNDVPASSISNDSIFDLLDIVKEMSEVQFGELMNYARFITRK